MSLASTTVVASQPVAQPTGTTAAKKKRTKKKKKKKKKKKMAGCSCRHCGQKDVGKVAECGRSGMRAVWNAGRQRPAAATQGREAWAVLQTYKRVISEPPSQYPHPHDDTALLMEALIQTVYACHHGTTTDCCGSVSSK
jgi:hypothetical protein